MRATVVTDTGKVEKTVVSVKIKSARRGHGECKRRSFSGLAISSNEEFQCKLNMAG
jgi:hypothetical protein